MAKNYADPWEAQNGPNQQNALNTALAAPAVDPTAPLGQSASSNSDPNAGWRATNGIQNKYSAQGGTGGAISRPGGQFEHIQNSGATSGITPVNSSGRPAQGGLDGTTPGAGTGAITPPANSLSSLGMDGLFGYDKNNFYDPEMQSVKYRFARLAQKAGARTPSQMQALSLSPEFQKEFPGAKFNGKDIMNFNGALSDGARGGVPVGDIDVLRAANQDTDTAEGTDWMPIEQGGMGKPAVNSSPWDKTGTYQTNLPAGAQTRTSNQSQSLEQLLAQLQQMMPGQAKGGY